MPNIVTQITAEQGGISERQLITDMLHRYHWNAHKASARIGVSYKTIYTRMRVLGIPTARELNSFRYGGHFDTIDGHAERLGLPVSRTVKRYRQNKPLDVVFSPVKMTPWQYVTRMESAA